MSGYVDIFNKLGQEIGDSYMINNHEIYHSSKLIAWFWKINVRKEQNNLLFQQ